MNFPTKEEFIIGVNEYESREPREAMYRIATFLVEHFWGDPADMADSIGVLLMTWNQAYHRFGEPNYYELEICISRNFDLIESYRQRDIFSYTNVDDESIILLFAHFMEALIITLKNGQVRRSPVGVSKTLHLLGPEFFPLWDENIAKGYNYNYANEPFLKYISFCKEMKIFAEQVNDYIEPGNKSIVKIIDQYNFAKYTRGWI